MHDAWFACSFIYFAKLTTFWMCSVFSCYCYFLGKIAQVAHFSTFVQLAPELNFLSNQPLELHGLLQYKMETKIDIGKINTHISPMQKYGTDD